MTDSDARLGELLGRYQRLRESDPGATISVLRSEAGPLYEELVDLAGCVDELATHVPVAAPEPPPPGPPVPRRGLLVLGAVAVLGSLLGAWALTDPDRWESQPEPPTVAAPVPPTDPFDSKEVAAFAKACGIGFDAPTGPLPEPLDAIPDVDAKQALSSTMPDVRALAVERGRVPEALRDQPSARYVVAERLYRAGHFRTCYDVAVALSDEFPSRKEPLGLVLRSLWGLELVESPLYADLLARYLALSDD